MKRCFLLLIIIILAATVVATQDNETESESLTLRNNFEEYESHQEYYRDYFDETLKVEYNDAVERNDEDDIEDKTHYMQVLRDDLREDLIVQLMNLKDQVRLEDPENDDLIDDINDLIEIINNFRDEISNFLSGESDVEDVSQTDIIEEVVEEETITEIVDTENLDLLELGTIYTESEDPCPEDYVQKLLAEKAALEAQASELESKHKEAQNELNELNEALEALELKKSSLQNELDNKKNSLQETESLLSDNNDALENTNEQIEKVEERIKEIQDFLAGVDGADVYSGGDPLQGMSSGGAISFDGGKTWLRGDGNSGVESLIDSMRKHKEMMKELREKGKELKDLNEQKDNLEEEKEKLEKDKEDLEKEISDLEDELKNNDDEINANKDEQSALEKEIKDIEAQVAELNKKINEFNKIAEKCGVKAKEALLDALEKYRDLPPEVKEEVDEEFDETATDEEKEIRDKHYEHDNTEDGGTGANDVAEKLNDIMTKASNCPPPSERKEGPFLDDPVVTVYTGVEHLWISNSQGTRGLTSQDQAEAMEQITKGINHVSTGDTGLGIISLISDYNPVSLVYGVFQSAATEAILDKIKEWQETGALRGLPVWIEISYGRLWEISVTETTSRYKNYVCEDGIWQFSYDSYKTDEEESNCVYSNGGTHRYEIENILDLDLSGCSSGSCPNAWRDAAKLALQSTLKDHLNGRVVGPCE